MDNKNSNCGFLCDCKLEKIEKTYSNFADGMKEINKDMVPWQNLSLGEKNVWIQTLSGKAPPKPKPKQAKKHSTKN